MGQEKPRLGGPMQHSLSSYQSDYRCLCKVDDGPQMVIPRLKDSVWTISSLLNRMMSRLSRCGIQIPRAETSGSVVFSLAV